MQPTSQYYCCAVANSSSGKASARVASQYDGSPPVFALTDFGAALTAGERIDIQGTLAGSQFKCQLTRENVAKSLMTPAGGKMGRVSFYASTPVDYRYVFVVTMAP